MTTGFDILRKSLVTLTIVMSIDGDDGRLDRCGIYCQLFRRVQMINTKAYLPSPLLTQ